jgi:hypothetical protein
MNSGNAVGPGPGLGTPAKVQNIAGQRLHFLPLKEYKYLTAPAARVMSESSPMYALIEDCVPKKQCAPFTAELPLTVHAQTAQRLQTISS